jgi:hypothetical protein
VSEKRIFVEGGGTSNELRTRCREGFHKLLENAGFTGRVPRIVACGSRNDAFDAFKTAHTSGRYDYVALIVDSEDAVNDSEKPWVHLTNRDPWERPANTTDDQVFLMTTCMETWLVADRAALKMHYGTNLQDSSLPALTTLETRHRHAVQDALVHASRNCTNFYAKDKRSFALLAVVKPATLQTHLPAFARMIRILSAKL